MSVDPLEVAHDVEQELAQFNAAGACTFEVFFGGMRLDFSEDLRFAKKLWRAARGSSVMNTAAAPLAERYRLGAALNLRSVPIGTTVSRGSALKPGRAVWLREASANVPACAPRPLRHHAQHGGTKAVFEMTYAGRLAMFAIRVSYPGGHSVWLTRRFPTVAWGLKKDALPFPTEADAARTTARLRPSGPVSIEPIAPEIARSA